MQILLLSIIAKCGVFTHVRELAVYLQKCGMEPVIGLINTPNARHIFKISDTDLYTMKESLNGISHFLYDTDEDILKYIDKKQIRLVHAHSPIVFSTAIKIAWQLNIPFVITLHGILNWGKLFGSAMEFADGIIAIGPEVAKSVNKEYQEKIRIIFNGIDIERFKPRVNNTVDGPLHILWIGRTNGSSSRGAEYLACAIRSLRKKGISIEAKVLGYPHGVTIRGMEICGWVHDPLPYLLWSHIVFARGRALREAMACGNVGILLAQGYGGIVRAEMFKNGKPALLSGSIKHGCTKLDKSLIAKDILYFHHNRKHLEKARMEARKIAEDSFDVKRMVEKICTVYEEAIKLHSIEITNKTSARYTKQN